jgi:hypothetical protein
MKSEFPFVTVPDTPGNIVGTPDTGTKLYNAYLWREQYHDWFLAVDQICQQRGVLAPVAAADFIQVSRVAVHKRLKEGRLTGFMFHRVTKTNHLADGKIEYETEGQPICFIPLVECLAWADEIAPRVKLKQGEDILNQYLNMIGGENNEEE